MKRTLLSLIFAFICITTMNSAKAQTYDPYAVQVINNLIVNHNIVMGQPDAPETWEFAIWNDETPKQLTKLWFTYGVPTCPLFGNASFSGLTTLRSLRSYENELTKLDVSDCTLLQEINCGDGKINELNLKNCINLNSLECNGNYLTELDVIHCTKLGLLYCYNNRLTKLDLTGLNNLTNFVGKDQNLSLTLVNNEIGEYVYSISLNHPTFGNSAISYSNGILKSTDNTVKSTSFTVQTGKPDFELSGTMSFTYSNVGINTPISIQSRVYPNPAKELFYIECENFNTIKLYDMLGKEVLTQNGKDKTEINISYLPSEIYIVTVFSEGKLMGNTKIVKQ